MKFIRTGFRLPVVVDVCAGARQPRASQDGMRLWVRQYPNHPRSPRRGTGVLLLPDGNPQVTLKYFPLWKDTPMGFFCVAIRGPGALERSCRRDDLFERVPNL